MWLVDKGITLTKKLSNTINIITLPSAQYKSIDLSNRELNETAASAIFEMIEYYEATNELDISSNPIGMTHRGWVSCNYIIGHSQELQVLNAEGNPISKMSADNLGSALSTSSLHTLKLEHWGLRGSPLSNLKEIDGDEDTEDRIRSSTAKNSSQNSG
uniref:Uncharacterized protein n=1 Tax=Glossina pallidipes TaxID=7398 RepID=A0A1A9ZH83_GLOPL